MLGPVELGSWDQPATVVKDCLPQGTNGRPVEMHSKLKLTPLM